VLRRRCDRRDPGRSAARRAIGFAQEDSSARVDDVLNEYRDRYSDPLWQLTVRALRTLPVEQAAAGALGRWRSSQSAQVSVGQ
jgi:hypothetical protein